MEYLCINKLVIKNNETTDAICILDNIFFYTDESVKHACFEAADAFRVKLTQLIWQEPIVFVSSSIKGFKLISSVQ